MSNDRLLRSLRRLASALTRLERLVAAEHEVSVSQLRCFLSLLEAPLDAGRRVSELATEQALAISTMTRNTAVLERQGLLLRRDDLSDRRAIRLLLTDHGRTLAIRLEAAVTARFVASFRDFHPSDKVERAVALERVATAIEKASTGA